MGRQEKNSPAVQVNHTEEDDYKNVERKFHLSQTLKQML